MNTGDCLYKYLDIKGALSMILNRELQFTNPNYFNDPFDNHPDLLNYEVSDKQPDGWDDFFKSKAYSDSINDRKSAWICSLSKTCNSMLMWSYYTGHKGVCIGLKNEALTKCLGYSDLGWMFFPNLEVEYKDVRNKPNGINGEVDTFLYQLCTKGKDWLHEQEVRHVIINPHPCLPTRMVREPRKDEIIPWDEVRFYPHLSPDCFDSIYLGCRISEDDKFRVLNAVKIAIPDVRVFQMTPDPDNFSSVAEPIDIDEFLQSHSKPSKVSLLTKLKEWFPLEIRITGKRKKRKQSRRTFRL